MISFSFIDKEDVQAIHRGELPTNITNSAALLDALSFALCFPDYFGGNWDALDECIRDLSWLPPGDIVLIHTDLPLANDLPALSVYLSILQDAIKNWDTRGSNLIYVSPSEWDAGGKHELLVKRKLHVVFPLNTASIVRSVLADNGSRE